MMNTRNLKNGYHEDTMESEVQSPRSGVEALSFPHSTFDVGRSMFMFFSVGTRSRRLFGVMGQIVEPMAESGQPFSGRGEVFF